MGIYGVDRVILQPGLTWRLPWYLRPGQMILVEALAVTGPEAVVRVAGQTFNARGELPSAPAAFWAVVEKVTPETLYLRQAAPETTAELSPADLARLLNLPADKETVQLLQEMLKRGLPLERQKILKLLHEGREIPEAERESFWAARVWLETLNLEDDPAKIRPALDYLLRRQMASPQGQETLNRAQPLLPDQEAISFLTFRGEEFSGEVYIISRETPSREDQLPTGVVVQTTTPLLGETWVCLSEKTTGLILKVVVALERFLEPAAEELGALQQKLVEMGYPVQQATVTTQPVQTVLDFLETGGTPGYRPVDAVV